MLRSGVSGDPGEGASSAGPGLLHNDALLLLAITAVAFSGALLAFGGLSFDFFKDEIDHWEQSLEFVEIWFPGVEELRSYDEPMTPLCFLFWASWELAFGLGLPGMRISSMVLSAGTLLLIGWRARTPGRRALLACVGLMLFPYWVGLSVVMYTDMLTAFLVVLGFFFYARGRGVASAVAFALAISARQYAVTYPVSLAAAELVPLLLGRAPWRPERVLPMAVAAASLLGWVAFFGGLGPKAGLEAYPTHMESLADVTPFHGLYFLSCVGAYFVVPEFLLFRRWREPWGGLWTRRNLAIAGALLVLFLLFPPDEGISMGPLNRATLLVVPPEVFGPVTLAVQILLFWTLAWLACVRFARLDLLFWMLLSRVVLMATAWEGWEKYNTALFAALWYLRSLSDLKGPLELWRLESDAASAREGDA